MDEILGQFTGFEWDAGNLDKSWKKHGVTPNESEEVFFNKPLLVYDDSAHSSQEQRHFCLGMTHGSRKLFVVFTARKNLVRIISARDMNRKERAVYEKSLKEV